MLDIESNVDSKQDEQLPKPPKEQKRFGFNPDTAALESNGKIILGALKPDTLQSKSEPISSRSP